MSPIGGCRITSSVGKCQIPLSPGYGKSQPKLCAPSVGGYILLVLFGRGDYRWGCVCVCLQNVFSKSMTFPLLCIGVLMLLKPETKIWYFRLRLTKFSSQAQTTELFHMTLAKSGGGRTSELLWK